MSNLASLLALGGAFALAAACADLGGQEGSPSGDGAGVGTGSGAGDVPCEDEAECEDVAGGDKVAQDGMGPEPTESSAAEPDGTSEGLFETCTGVPGETALLGTDFSFAPTRGYASAGHVASLLLRAAPTLPDPAAIRATDFVNLYGAPVDGQARPQVAVVSMRPAGDGLSVLFDVETSVPVRNGDAQRSGNAVVLFAESASLFGSDGADAFGFQKQAVRSLVGALTPADRVWLAGWGADFRVALADADVAEVEPALATFATPTPSGRLEEAIDRGVSLLRDGGREGDVFVFFDGSVPASHRLDDVIKAAQRAGVTVHALVVNESGYFDRVGIERIERGGGASLFVSRDNGGLDVLRTRSRELFGHAFAGAHGTLFYPSSFVPVTPDSLDGVASLAGSIGPDRFVTARHVLVAPPGGQCNATFDLSYAFDGVFSPDLIETNAFYQPSAASTEPVVLTTTRVETIQRVVALLKVAGSRKVDVVPFVARADEALMTQPRDERMTELVRVFCSAVALAKVAQPASCAADAF